MVSVNTWDSILTIIVFFIANAIVLFPFRIRIPVPTLVTYTIADILVKCRIIPSSSPHSRRLSRVNSRWKQIQWLDVNLNFQTVPLISVVILLSSRSIDGAIVRQGILGADGVQPLDIMALFMSLAYLSISLDATGLFRFLAFWVARKGGSSGRRLYLYLYAFFLVSGVFVGNDPVILSGTAFLAYFTRVSGITPPTAWIFAQFSAANMASAVLPPSNPTNLVLTGAFAIPFLSYAAHTVLPVLSAALLTYPLLIYMFRSSELIPAEIDLQGFEQLPSATNASEITQRSATESDMQVPRPTPGALTDRHGAIFGSVLLSVTLIVLVGTSPLKVPVWQVTIPPALIMVGRDVWHDRKRLRAATTRNKATKHGSEPATIIDADLSPETDIELQDIPPRHVTVPATSASSNEHSDRTLLSLIRHLQHAVLPTVSSIVTRLPLALLPFALCMFVLVQALASKGWVEIFAHWWEVWVRTCDGAGPRWGVAGAVTAMLLVTTLLCNVCGTNIGATILLARVIQIWIQSSSASAFPVSSSLRTGTIYALALGSNFGAFSFSFSASLAGLLWRSILRQKGIHVHRRQFVFLNLPIICTAVCVASGVLTAEMLVAH